jgi:hypothetical protein
VSWEVIPPTGGKPVVTAVFQGDLSAEEGKESAAAFQAAFAGAPLAVVWDVTKMAGFDGGARTAWAEVVWPIRDQISSLKIIGARGMVRVGATFLALLLGKPYEFVNAHETEPKERAS